MCLFTSFLSNEGTILYYRFPGPYLHAFDSQGLPRGAIGERIITLIGDYQKALEGVLSESAPLLRQVAPAPALGGLVSYQSITSLLVWTKHR